MTDASFDSAPPRPGRSVLKRFALAALIITLSAAGTFATASLLEFKDDVAIFDSVSKPIAGLDEKGVLDNVDPGGPQTILVLGSDRRFIEKKARIPARSDTILLIRLDPSKGATAVLSIPRDLRVQIPGYGMHKINEAYEDGGPKLSVKTIRALLHIPISHVVNINFGGFRRAVDRLGCVFLDVDRRYFNDNMPPNGGGSPYAVIDVKAGYQRLCGEDALSYVRFRHLDNDLVRGARQQDFLSQAKDQIGVSRIISDRKNLLKIFGKYTQTDIHGTDPIFRLIKLAIKSAGNPVQAIKFEPVTDAPVGSDLLVTPGTAARLGRQFMDAKVLRPRGEVKQPAKAKHRKHKGRSVVPAGLFEAKQTAEDQAVRLATDPKRPLSFPVYFPRLAVLGSVYRPQDGRAYRIRDRDKKSYQAYRIVVSAPGTGQYYGVQGMTWKSPPILDAPSESRTVNGRKLELFRNGRHLRVVAWRTRHAVYWVSNTLQSSLTNTQMLGIAESLTRVGN